MRTARHARRSLVAVFTATLTLTLMFSVARPTVPARAADSQDVTIAEAVAQAADTGQPVLATASTTESSSVVANPDGTLTATLGAGPLQEPDPSSDTGWAPIDLSLQHVDGSYAPAVSAADTTFSGGGSGALASMDQGSTTYTENWDGTLPTPTVSGDTATYADVLPNIDLVMTAQTTGFKQSFVVKAAPTSQLTLDVPLSLRGLTAVIDDNGNLIVTDAAGNIVATAGTAVMYGAAVDPSGEPTTSETVDTQVVDVGGTPVFRITPDPAFFSDPAVQFPVTIDPSPNLTVTADAYVKQSAGTSSFSTNNDLKVGSPDGTDKLRSLISFGDITDVLGPGAVVDEATLNLHETDSYSCTASQVNVYDASSSWDSTVTWNTQPTAGTLWASGSFAKGHSSSCPGGWIALSSGGASGASLTDMVQGWADGDDGNGGDGVIVEAASETSTTGWKKFNASESGANAPTLTVTYRSPDYGHTDTGFWFNDDRDHTHDSQSGNWLTDLHNALGTGNDHIQLSGASDPDTGGVPWYWFYQGSSQIIYCRTWPTPCPGFDGSSVVLTYFDPARALPSDDLDSQISIKDVSMSGAGETVWFHHFCPPTDDPYTSYSSPWCDDNSVEGEWTAGSMTHDDYLSDGMDGCWYNNYKDLIPTGYQEYDANNEGDYGTPSSFTAIRQWEVHGTGMGYDMLHRSLVIHLPENSSENFFPMVGSDGVSGDIPEGAILYLKSDASIPEGATPELVNIIDALKNYGAVVGTTDTNPTASAEIDLENVAVDGYHFGEDSYTWAQLGVDQDSLSDYTFDPELGDFYFSEAGGDGPSQQEWANDEGTKCETEPGS